MQCSDKLIQTLQVQRILQLNNYVSENSIVIAITMLFLLFSEALEFFPNAYVGNPNAHEMLYL